MFEIRGPCGVLALRQGGSRGVVLSLPLLGPLVATCFARVKQCKRGRGSLGTDEHFLSAHSIETDAHSSPPYFFFPKKDMMFVVPAAFLDGFAAAG